MLTLLRINYSRSDNHLFHTKSEKTSVGSLKFSTTSRSSSFGSDSNMVSSSVISTMQLTGGYMYISLRVSDIPVVLGDRFDRAT